MALRNHAEEQGELEAVKADMRERKIMELIISKATITEMKPEKKTAAKPAKKAEEKKPARKKASVRTKAVKSEAPKKPAKKTSTRSKAVKDEKPAKKKVAKKGTKKSDKTT